MYNKLNSKVNDLEVPAATNLIHIIQYKADNLQSFPNFLRQTLVFM